MAGLMLPTFFTTGGTYFRTHLTDHARELASARDGSARQTTNLGAIDIQRNAARHHFHILFLQTGGCTMIAGVGASMAGFDTGFKLLWDHDFFSFHDCVG
jgi:hypothetical protein